MARKFFFTIIFYIFVLCSKAYADEVSYFPAMGSLTSSLSFPSNSKSINTTFSLGILNAEYNDLYGFGVAFLYQESFGDIYGLQVSLVNFANNIQYGSQVGVYNKIINGNLAGQIGAVNRAYTIDGTQIGYVNLANCVYGTQIGFVNVVSNIKGPQVGLVDVADSVKGVQIGFVNTTSDVTGLQLGLVNYAENEEGTSIGLISFVKNGTFRISTTYSSQNEPSIQTELGGKKVYNIIRYSYEPHEKRLEYWIGFGANLNLYENKFYFYPQFFFAGPYSSQAGYGLTGKFGYLFSEHFEAISGTNFTVNNDETEKRFGFLHRDKYNVAFFLGVQVDFKESVFNMLFAHTK